MTVAITDKFIKGARKLAGTIDSSGIINDTIDNFGLSSATGLPTDTPVEITVDRVDSNGNLTPDKEEVIKGIVSGNRIINAVRGTEGTAQAHSPGAVFEVRLTAHQWEELIDGIQEEHNPDGTHKLITVNEQSSDPATPDSGKMAIYAKENKLFAKDDSGVEYLLSMNYPKGFLINGKIEVTDTGSGLTVALKTLAGADPSASDPIYCRIGNTIRTITSALSRTLADGTNWFNAGSAELATKEIDYFAYLVWDSNSSAVGISFARIPYANLISDFSATTTNEKYCAGYSDFTTTDEVENIGRFAATLSAGAGYTWSVPTYTASNLIQRPIYETRLLEWLPGYNGWLSISARSGLYKIINNNLFIESLFIQGISNSTTTQSTLPFSPLSVTKWFPFRATDNGTILNAPSMAGFGSSATFSCYKDWAGSLFTASGSKVIERLTLLISI